MTIEELEAEVERCQAALNQAKHALYKAQIAPAKYHKDEWVMARRILPGHSYRDKTLWPARIVQVYPPRWDGYDISYRIYWRLKDGKFSAKSTSVLERDIEGLEEQ